MQGQLNEEPSDKPVFASFPQYCFRRCVEGKEQGLREGDECMDEADAYKKCRKLLKEAGRGDANNEATGDKKEPR